MIYPIYDTLLAGLTLWIFDATSALHPHSVQIIVILQQELLHSNAVARVQGEGINLLRLLGLLHLA